MNPGEPESCRCGWNGEGEHKCHRCHERPGLRRLYLPHFAALAGQTMKVVVRDTYACDECWDAFHEALGEAGQ